MFGSASVLLHLCLICHHYPGSRYGILAESSKPINISPFTRPKPTDSASRGYVGCYGGPGYNSDLTSGKGPR
jgi:hypothetical protein